MTPLGMTPQSMKFQIVGLFTTGMYDYDSDFAYVALPIAQKMYALGDNVNRRSGIEEARQRGLSPGYGPSDSPNL